MIRWPMLVVALVACHRGIEPTAVLPIAVVSWPSPIRPHCTLPELPPLPPLAAYTTTTGTALERTYVGVHELNDLRMWLAQASHLIVAQRACLEKLTGPVQ